MCVHVDVAELENQAVPRVASVLAGTWLGPSSVLFTPPPSSTFCSTAILRQRPSRCGLSFSSSGRLSAAPSHSHCITSCAWSCCLQLGFGPRLALLPIHDNVHVVARLLYRLAYSQFFLYVSLFLVRLAFNSIAFHAFFLDSLVPH